VWHWSCGFGVVYDGPCVVLEQILCYRGIRSLRVTGAVAAWLWKVFRAWYLSSGFVVVERGACMALELWLCGSGTWSVRFSRFGHGLA
jgi:hypothetical protein